MTAIHHFQAFEEIVRNTLQDAQSEKDIVNSLSPHFRSFIEIEGLVPDELKHPKSAEKYGQYLLYKPKDEAFSIVAFVWGPGQIAPIHDHLVWGLVGIYEGAVEETRYRKLDNDDSTGGFQLEVIDTIIAKKNDVSFVYPPNSDIHSVRNPFENQAVTIHIYGTDIGKQPRHSYKDDSIQSILTPHVNETPVYSY